MPQPPVSGLIRAALNFISCQPNVKKIPVSLNCPSKARQPRPRKPNAKNPPTPTAMARITSSPKRSRPSSTSRLIQKIGRRPAHARGSRVSGLCQLRHPRPRDSESRGRFEAGAAAHPAGRCTTMDDGRFIKVANVIGRHDAISSARRCLHWRRARGAGEQALSHRRPGKFRQHLHRRSRRRAALHRMPPDGTRAHGTFQRRNHRFHSQLTTGATRSRSPCPANCRSISCSARKASRSA